MNRAEQVAREWLARHKLQPTPGALQMVERRMCALGPLAVLPSMLSWSWVVRVQVWEHGPDLVPAGQAMAHVWVRARGQEQLQERAGQVHRAVEADAWARGTALVVAVHGASRRDEWRARREWRAWRRAAK